MSDFYTFRFFERPVQGSLLADWIREENLKGKIQSAELRVR